MSPTASPPPVVEDGPFRPRLRRPADVIRAFIALTACVTIGSIAYLGVDVVSSFDGDLQGLASSLPSFVRLPLGLIAGIGVLAIPIAASIYLLLRGRGRLLIDALIALFVAVTALLLLAFAVASAGNDRLTEALAGQASSSAPVEPTLGGLIAFIAVARLMTRPRWAAAAVLVVLSSVFTIALAGRISSAGLAVSVLTGWSIGLLARWIFGTPTTRPPGREVAEALARIGIPVAALRAEPRVVGGRAYEGLTATAEPIDVVVLDRDLDGSGLLGGLWRAVRYRENVSRGGQFSMRQTLERAALMGFAARACEVPSPRLLAVTDVGPDSAALVYEQVPGERVAARESDDDPAQQGLDDERLRSAWRSLDSLQQARLAHGDLCLSNLLFGQDGRTYLLALDRGGVAASDLLLRVDVATMLCSLALASDPEAAVRTGIDVLGADAIARALPVLQKVALPGEVRSQVRRRTEVLPRLRELVATIGPAVEVEQVQVERIQLRTVVLLVFGSIAAYVLVVQLGNVDLEQIITGAKPGWVAAALLLSGVTYVGAALSLQGFTAERIQGWRTFLAQLAASFTTLVAPPTVGTVAINVRYLQKSGLHPALAAATVALGQVAAFSVHVVLLVLLGVIAGSSDNFNFNPPRAVLIGAAIVALSLVLLVSQPRTRHWIVRRIGPTLSQVGPRLGAVVQQPRKLLAGIGGILILNTAYCLALICSVRAFSPDLSPAAIAFVYFAGATIGSAAPTPGGLGAVEAALAAGLTAAGLPAAVAVPAVLLFRICTFWIPTIPGWFAFRWLTKVEAI